MDFAALFSKPYSRTSTLALKLRTVLVKAAGFMVQQIAGRDAHDIRIQTVQFHHPIAAGSCVVGGDAVAARAVIADTCCSSFQLRLMMAGISMATREFFTPIRFEKVFKRASMIVPDAFQQARMNRDKQIVRLGKMVEIIIQRMSRPA